MKLTHSFVKTSQLLPFKSTDSILRIKGALFWSQQGVRTPIFRIDINNVILDCWFALVLHFPFEVVKAAAILWTLLSSKLSVNRLSFFESIIYSLASVGYFMFIFVFNFWDRVSLWTSPRQPQTGSPATLLFSLTFLLPLQVLAIKPGPWTC